MNQWEIWLAYVKFFDRPDEEKIRPVLIINEEVCFVLAYNITSHKPRNNFFGEYDIIRWKESGLEKPSTVRLSSISKIKKEKFIRKIGKLNKLDMEKIVEILELYGKL